MKFKAPVDTTHISCAGMEIKIEPDGGFEAPEAQRESLLAHGCRVFASLTLPSEAIANEKNAGSAPKCRQARSRASRSLVEQGL